MAIKTVEDAVAKLGTAGNSDGMCMLKPSQAKAIAALLERTHLELEDARRCADLWKADHDRKQAALEKHGRHDKDCAANVLTCADTLPCTCGYAESLE